jgi:putative ABC transport system ATP-binding protein
MNGALIPSVLATRLAREFTLGDEVVHALRGVTFKIDRGEMVTIMGPSGSGKSTLMHLIGCLDTPSSGSIEIDGQATGGIREVELAALRNRKIGFVFQQFNLLARQTIFENVMTPLVYAGLPVRDRRERAEAALGRVGLAERLRHKPAQLSGGQRQRAAIARAIVGNPSIILADEPTGALDQGTGERIMELFRSINGTGTTVVIVTHDPGVGAQCDRVIRLRDGVIMEASNVP